MKRALQKQINDERLRQIAQWGGEAHDDRHTAPEWNLFREKFEARVIDGVQVRPSLVKIIALAVAQIESLDRKEAVTCQHCREVCGKSASRWTSPRSRCPNCDRWICMRCRAVTPPKLCARYDLPKPALSYFADETAPQRQARYRAERLSK